MLVELCDPFEESDMADPVERPKSWRHYWQARWRPKNQWLAGVLAPFAFAEWTFEWINYGLQDMALFDVVDRLGRLSILVLVIGYFWTRGEAIENARKQREYQAWQVINTALAAGGSGGRVYALQDLHRSGVSLRSIRLDGAVLDTIDLQPVTVSGQRTVADLRFAKMPGVSLRFARLDSAQLFDADLSGADLSWAILRSADLRFADLNKADLNGATLWDADLRFADLSGAYLEYAQFDDTRLFGANLFGALEVSSSLMEVAVNMNVICVVPDPSGVTADTMFPITVAELVEMCQLRP